MSFELDKALIDDILFHMENQDGVFLLDTLKGVVIDMDNNDYDSDRYISLPEWSSADGYRLMERFTASLKNPVLREELSIALNRNRGVFRAFRDALSQHPEAEKHWYNFKDKEMKDEVIAWYNALREEWGMEPIGEEPEETDSLVREDFVIIEDHTQLKENGYACYIAETAAGKGAGRIYAFFDASTIIIKTLEVEPEYRGMGIAKTLLSKLLEKADAQKLNVMIDVPTEADFFARSLLLENFKPCMKRFVRKGKQFLYIF